jgi:isopentenyl diphosphate isomerase/L-lactate dehydrogenase-like FMN-dependent dehydrogenase
MAAVKHPSEAPPEYLTLAELEARAREVLATEAWDYATGGSASETTLQRNRRALERLAIQQYVLVDVREIDLRTQLVGVTLPSPILIAPMGALYRFHPEGDLEMARGAGRDGSMLVLSGVTGWPVEEVIAAGDGAPLMFQIYHHGDREWAEEYIVGRVQRAGFRAMCLTVDTALYSRRERDLHNRFAARVRRPGSALPDPTYPARLTWDDVRWLRDRLRVPFGLKGVLTVEDALRAIDAGLDFIWLSNHGGRQLDDARATIDALAEIAPVVAGRVPLVVDGGFRRGTDIIKALAFGATAVAVGRTFAYGLAADGADGVAQTLRILQQELRINLGLAGQTSVRGLSSAIIRTVDY